MSGYSDERAWQSRNEADEYKSLQNPKTRMTVENLHAAPQEGSYYQAIVRRPGAIGGSERRVVLEKQTITLHVWRQFAPSGRANAIAERTGPRRAPTIGLTIRHPCRSADEPYRHHAPFGHFAL